MPKQSVRRKFYLTASMVRAYKSCPKKYWFDYVEQLKPAVEPVALTIGTDYHACIESILRGQEFKAKDPIVEAMATAFMRFIDFRSLDVLQVEKKFEVKFPKTFFSLRGKMDAICLDGSVVEHKTTRNALDDKYVANLILDDQVTLYLLAQSMLCRSPVTRVHYTAVQKPTIRKKMGETDEEFLDRVKNWYTPERVKLFTVVRSEKELEEARDELLLLYKEIKNRKFFYRNPSHCSIYGCPYFSICLNYDPEVMTGFVKKSSMCEELEAGF